MDQNKWIDLGRAMHGRKDGDRFREALDVCRVCVEAGVAEFPLSTGHYIETWRIGDPGRRRRLAQTMLALSQGRTLARPPDLCDSELDGLMAEIAESGLARAPWPPLGWGFFHSSGLRPDQPKEEVDVPVELEHLANRPPGFNQHGQGHREFGDLYRDGEAGLLSGDQEAQLPNDLREDVLAVSAIMEIWENIEWALQRAGLPADALGPIGRVRPDLPPDRGGELLNEVLPLARGFIGRLPTRDATLALRIERHRNPTNKWESNDMIDIAYLACATVHCDVIVTEKQWVHELGKSGLLDTHRTTALSDVAEIPQALITAFN